jgi:uncharacterized glyoxalase superfamily protein PhnB
MAAKKRKPTKQAAPKRKASPKAKPRLKMPIRNKPEAFRARAAHTSFTVNDLAKSIAFYRDGIGFTQQEEWKNDGKLVGVGLRAGTVEIFLSQDDGAKGWDRKKGIACSVSFITAQKVDDVAARLKKAGYALLSEPTNMPWGSRAFRVADPDGFLIGISS